MSAQCDRTDWTAWIARGDKNSHYRALEGDVPGIRDRLAAGDSIGLADSQGFTALHFAAQQSKAEAIRALIEAGAPVNPQDRFGNTPLWREVFNSRGQRTTVELLLRRRRGPRHRERGRSISA